MAQGRVTLIRGVSYEKGEASTTPEPGRVCLLRANNIGDEITFDDVQYVPESRVSRGQYLRPGDVVIAMSSGSKSVVGKAAFLREPWNGTFGAFCGVLRPSPHVDQMFFGFFFKTRYYRDAISELSAGTNINNLKRQYFDEVVLPLPPLAEQHRIVTQVEALLARVNAARERLAKVPVILKRFRQSILAAACSGRLTEDVTIEAAARSPDEQDDATASAREILEAEFAVLKDVPNSWRWKLFGSLVTESLYGPRFSSEQYADSGIATVRTTDIDFSGSIVFKDPPRVQLSANELRRFELKDGDLLVTRTGATIGKCAVYRQSLGPAIPSAYLIRFRFSQQSVASRYALLFLMSPFGQRLLGAGQTAVAQPNVNAKTIAGFSMPLPPLPEQHEIVRRVDALFKVAHTIQERVKAATARTEKLTHAILGKAFRGELVPTEAELAHREGRDYEPAAVLLERIRAEREAQNPSPRPSPRGRGRRRTQRASRTPAS